MNDLTAYDQSRLQELEAQHASGNLPEDMLPYLKWLRGDRKPKIPESHMHVYRQARKIINEYVEEHTQKEAIEHFGIYQSLIYRLQEKKYSRVPYQKCKEIIKKEIKVK